MPIKLLSWNVNGYRAALKKGFGEFLLASGADVLGLQEVKSCPEQLSPADTSFPGYQCSWNCAQRKGYSGVAAFYKAAPLAVANGFGEERFDAEGRVITLEYPKFYLLNVYFPNGGQGPERLKYKLDFYEAFLDHIEGLRKSGKAVLFCGDVNTAHNEIDLARPKENVENSGFMPVERAWLDKLTGKGWVDTFRTFHSEPGQYSWWDYKTRARERNVGWRIDYFFVNKEKASLVKDAFILPEVRGSDHCPVGVTLEL
ncbi:MAG TPA: exodeoxyribonuclease III [Elusimicrobia bacterium]|nr:MAG: exodeoxyribonuclease III [Elusimicrobia bacterium GWA2_64_40]OGR63763.1 MAG: exodeoxyribonuclease III [Elusimicrobia bacterium GWB2_63_16]HAN05492.1 exodeoxyribonuclease III [Elusimicrobiota bacterium]HAU89067.1 exodeoxyribonuclease III [Elusimicrobiota bacterium]